jgi:hypothetical protein
MAKRYGIFAVPIKLDRDEVNDMPGRARVLSAMRFTIQNKYKIVNLVTPRWEMLNDLADLVFLVDVRNIPPFAIVDLIQKVRPDEVEHVEIKQFKHILHFWWD